MRSFVALLNGLVLLTSSPVLAEDQENGDAGTPSSGSAVPKELVPLLQQQTEDAAKAKAAEDIAKAKQQLAEQEAQSASGAKAVADNAKLLKSGITVGISAGLQFPIGSTKGTSLQNAAFVAMPYVIFLPAYWSATEARREYCASEWSGGGESDAAAAATEVARRKASNKFDTFVSAIQADATDAQILNWESSKEPKTLAEFNKIEADFKAAVKKYGESDEKLKQALQKLREAVAQGKEVPTAVETELGKLEEARQELLAAQEQYTKAVNAYLLSRSKDTMASIVAKARIWIYDTKLEPQAREARKTDIIRWISEQDWNSSLRGRCGTLKWGAFLGRPLNHEVRVKVRGIGTETRNFVPHLAFGATFTPNAYVSVLAGVTLGDVERQGPEGTPRDARTTWAGNVSLGGNFDLAAALIKGAQSIP